MTSRFVIYQYLSLNHGIDMHRHASTCIDMHRQDDQDVWSLQRLFRIILGDFTIFSDIFGPVAIRNVIWHFVLCCYAVVQGKLGRQSCEWLSVHPWYENLVILFLGMLKAMLCHALNMLPNVAHVIPCLSIEIQFVIFVQVQLLRTLHCWVGILIVNQGTVELRAFVCLQLVEL